MTTLQFFNIATEKIHPYEDVQAFVFFDNPAREHKGHFAHVKGESVIETSSHTNPVGIKAKEIILRKKLKEDEANWFLFKNKDKESIHTQLYLRKTSIVAIMYDPAKEVLSISTNTEIDYFVYDFSVVKYRKLNKTWKNYLKDIYPTTGYLHFR